MFLFVFISIVSAMHVTRWLNVTTIHGKNDKSRLILCGDTALLGFKIRIAQLNMPYCVLKQSLLNRLVKNDHFRTDPRLMIRLSKNYRSHKSIVDAMSTMLEETIVASENFNDTLDLTSITSQPSSRVIFQNVVTETHELDDILDYLKNLRNMFFCSDIGVITPHYSQAEIIQQHVEEDLGILVDAVDQFYDVERKAILISCTLDFDNIINQQEDPAWLNMAVSRAKSLVIIVGRSSYVERLPEGKRLIDFCIKNKAFFHARLF